MLPVRAALLVPIALGASLALTGCVGFVTEPPPPEAVDPEAPPPGIPPVDEACVTSGVPEAPLGRLTNRQYANAVADLLAPLTPPPSEIGAMPESAAGGFTSNAALSVSDSELQLYREEAARAASVVTRAWALGECDPATDGPRVCQRGFIRRVARRAFRRPVTDEEVDRLLALFDLVIAEGTFPSAASAVVEAILLSPHFLYRLETPEGFGGDVVALDDHQLAARLALLLWETLPDEALLAAADAGELTAEGGLEAHARRMLADARAARGVSAFHEQWLGVGEVPDADKDAEAFPAHSPELAAAMHEEALRFTDHVVREGDGRYETLFVGGFTFLDGPLYALYGVAPQGEWSRVTLPPERSGVLTLPAFLSAHSHEDQTSPVHRGRAIRESFFCETLPAPPPNVNDTPPDPDPGLTTAERFAAHTEVPSCAGCHRLMDPIGLAFEHYDGVGRYRDDEGGLAIDDRGEIVGTDTAGELEGVIELSERLAASEQARQCMLRNWFRFALGRLEETIDTCTLSRLNESFQLEGHNVRELLIGIVLSDAFRTVQRPEE